MNSRWHLYISVIKSVIRLAGCALAIFTGAWIHLAWTFGIAEVLGVLEELGDKR